MNIAERKAARERMLKAVFDLVDGSERRSANMWEVGQSIGLDRETTDDAVSYLVQEGLLRYHAMGGAICITHAGIKSVEN